MELLPTASSRYCERATGVCSQRTVAFPVHRAWHSMRRALPRVPLGGSDQICSVQAGTVPTDGPVPFSVEGDPQLMPSTAVPCASAGGLMVVEPGSVVVAGHAVGLPATRSWGAGPSVEGGSVAAAGSRMVSASGSRGVVARAVVGSCVGTLGSGGSAVVVTGPAVLGVLVIVTTVQGLAAEVAMATGCSVTAVNTVCHGGLAMARSWDGASLADIIPVGWQPPLPTLPDSPLLLHPTNTAVPGRERQRVGTNRHPWQSSGDRDKDGKFAERCRNGGRSHSSKAISSSAGRWGGQLQWTGQCANPGPQLPRWHSPPALTATDATRVRVSCPMLSVTLHLNSTPSPTSSPATSSVDTMSNSSSSVSVTSKSGCSSTWSPRYQVRTSPMSGYACRAEQRSLAGCPGSRARGSVSSCSVSGRAERGIAASSADFWHRSPGGSWLPQGPGLCQGGDEV